MSQLTTAPETNPTEVVNSFHQVLNVKPAVQIIDFGADDVSDMAITNSFNMSQPDWVKLASKNKYLDKFTWNIADVGLIWDREIDFTFLSSLIPAGLAENSYVKFSKVLFSIKPTNNAFMKGLAYVGCYSAPRSYAGSVVGTPSTTDARVFYQLKHAALSPNNSDEINFMVPIVYPFERFKTAVPTPATPSLGYSNNLYNYMRDYKFCTLYCRIYDQLATTSAVTSLDFTVSAQILDLELNGVRFNST